MFKLICGDMLNELDNLEENSVDSIVTDPPYEINFINKSWDNSGISYQKETWEKCLRVLKPGGYLLAFAAPRTQHRIACAVEDAGFEIRDTIMWLYGSGFPKSMNIGLAIDKKNGVDNRTGNIKIDGVVTISDSSYYYNSTKREYEERIAQNEWAGWGTALKPAYEPIIVARKPCEGNCVDNVLKYGVGGINIDECRVPFENTQNPATNPLYRVQNGYKSKCGSDTEPSAYTLKKESMEMNVNEKGRFPANLILTYDDTDFDEVCGEFPQSGSGNNGKPYNYAGREYNNKDTSMFNGDKPQAPSNYNDSGSASRYFYCAKASTRDREEGLSGVANDENKTRKNTHPTVKPTSLMQYLVRLVTPKNGTILDPFMGSGSTGKAVAYENNDRDANYSFIGIELNEEYVAIADKRIEFAKSDDSELDVNISEKLDTSVEDDKNTPARKKLF